MPLREPLKARFTGPDMTLISYEYIHEEGDRRETFVTYDTSIEECQHVLKHFDPEKLAENYHAWNEDNQRFRLAVQQVVRDELNVVAKEKKEEVGEIEEPLTFLLGHVLNLTKENDPEGLFKLKLDVFETKEMSTSEDKELRAKIRRANTALKVLALYHTVFEKGIDDSPDE